MLVIQRYFEAGQFISDTPVAIPENKKTIITVLDKKAQKIRNGEAWDTFLQAIENSNEELSGLPERIRFRTPEEIDRYECLCPCSSTEP
jgi:hypothetical protein